MNSQSLLQELRSELNRFQELLETETLGQHLDWVKINQALQEIYEERAEDEIILQESVETVLYTLHFSSARNLAELFHIFNSMPDDLRAAILQQHPSTSGPSKSKE